jgi:hypothetical protein
MILGTFKLAAVRSAVAECAKKVAPFSIYRVRSDFDWIPERKRFVFSKLRFEKRKSEYVLV